MDREAKIKLIAEGASRAASGVREVKSEVSGLGKVAENTQSALKEIGKAAYRAASDYARVANDTRPISFQSAADSAKRFDDVVTRLAVRSNRDIGALKLSFRETGKEIGVLPERVANAARALTKMTGSTDAAEAMRDLGTEANDTDRSIEEITEVGATLYNKLGVPLNKLGETLAHVKGVALDFQHVGGKIALEDSLVRLAPLLAKFEGGASRAAATIAHFSKGKSREVGERVSQSIYGAFAGADPLLVTRKMRQLTGDKNYQPYTLNDQGEAVLKNESMVRLQQHFKKRPFGAALRFFGNDLTATQAFLDRDLREVDRAEAQTKSTQAALRGQGAMDLQNLRPSDKEALAKYSRDFNQRVLGEKAAPTGLAATAAGQREQTSVERSEVELKVGEDAMSRADTRNAMYRGQRNLQAGIDTFKGYAPAGLDRAMELAEAAAVDGAARGARMPSAPGRVDKLTVDLSTASVKAIGDTLRTAPFVVRPNIGPAAQATEDSKRSLSGAANH